MENYLKCKHDQIRVLIPFRFDTSILAKIICEKKSQIDI